MSLPTERRVLNGRTYAEAYNPASFNAAYGPYRSPRHSTDWIIAAALVITILVLTFGVW